MGPGDAFADQATGLGEIGDVDPNRGGAGDDDDTLAHPSEAGRVREAGVSTDPKAAEEHMESRHPRRIVLARPEVLAQEVHDTGIGVDGPLHRDRLQDSSVDVTPSIDDHRRKETG